MFTRNYPINRREELSYIKENKINEIYKKWHTKNKERNFLKLQESEGFYKIEIVDTIFSLVKDLFQSIIYINTVVSPFCMESLIVMKSKEPVFLDLMGKRLFTKELQGFYLEKRYALELEIVSFFSYVIKISPIIDEKSLPPPRPQ